MIRSHSRWSFPYGKCLDKKLFNNAHKIFPNLNTRKAYDWMCKMQNRKTRYAKHDEFKVDFNYKENDDDTDT